MNNSELYTIDKRWLRRSFDRAAAQYDATAVLQQEIGLRLIERLNLIKLNPDAIVDIGAGTGRQSRLLNKRYPNAQLLALDLSSAMLQFARTQLSWWQRWQHRQSFICGDAEQLPLANNSVDLIFSNVTLQWCDNLDAVFNEFHRILRPGGLLLFSSFGPDTLHELRHSWQAADPHNHVNAFIDMHDIGDALLRAGMGDPVMDMEMITLTYRELRVLLAELKIIGAHNVTAGRPRGLTGKNRIKKLYAAYEQYRSADNLLPASYEVIYGHAWKNEKINTDNDTSISIPVSAIKNMRRSSSQAK